MNRFRNYVLMAVGFAVLAMTVGAFTAGRAIAQPVRAALMSNVDDPDRIPYRLVKTCEFANSQICNVVLPSVPLGKRLVITHVSGLFNENLPSGTLIVAQINQTFLPLTFAGNLRGQNYFVFDQQELIFVNNGEQAIVQVTVGDIPTGDSGFTITLSGYLLDCTTAPCAAIAP